MIVHFVGDDKKQTKNLDIIPDLNEKEGGKFKYEEYLQCLKDDTCICHVNLKKNPIDWQQFYSLATVNGLLKAWGPELTKNTTNCQLFVM